MRDRIPRIRIPEREWLSPILIKGGWVYIADPDPVETVKALGQRCYCEADASQERICIDVRHLEIVRVFMVERYGPLARRVFCHRPPRGRKKRVKR